MTTLKQAAQDVIEDVDSPYIPDEIRMVDVKLIEALRKALQAESLYTAPPSIEALIAEIDWLDVPPVAKQKLKFITDKYRNKK